MEPRLLLIEDDEAKQQSVLASIRDSLPKAEVVECNSVRRALDTIAKEAFDLVIADMSLPTFDVDLKERGGTPRPFGGIEVFEYLERIESTMPVLVVTSYPVLTDGKRSVSYADLKEQLKRDFPSNYAGLVYFDSAYAEWKREIKQFLLERFGAGHA